MVRFSVKLVGIVLVGLVWLCPPSHHAASRHELAAKPDEPHAPFHDRAAMYDSNRRKLAAKKRFVRLKQIICKLFKRCPPPTAPTKRPTVAPTKVPVPRPTSVPIPRPILTPNVPTKAPTKAPTTSTALTKIPTKSPINSRIVPTKAPTKPPTKVPTKAPTLLDPLPVLAPIPTPKGPVPTLTPTFTSYVPPRPLTSCRQSASADQKCNFNNFMHRFERGRCITKCVPEQLYDRHKNAQWKCGNCPTPAPRVPVSPISPVEPAPVPQAPVPVPVPVQPVPVPIFVQGPVKAPVQDPSAPATRSPISRPSVPTSAPIFAPDTTPPKLINLFVVPFIVNVSNGNVYVVVEVSVQDDQSGLYQGQVEVTNGLSGDIAWYEPIVSSGNAVVKFNVTLLFRPYIPEGNYALSVTLQDNISNVILYSSRDLAALNFPHVVQVINARVDTSPPTLVNVSVTRNQVSTRNVTVRVEINDTQSGVNAVEVRAGPNIVRQDKVSPPVVGRHTFLLNLSLTNPEPPGRYPLELYVWDTQNNLGEFNATRLASLGFASSVDFN